MSSPYGFVADPGPSTSFVHGGDLDEIARRLGVLANRKRIRIVGISGGRSPAASAALPGGSANDPHTKGAAWDIAVNSHSRASAGQLTDADLKSVGLERPFAGAAEINHIQLAGGQSTLGKIAGAAKTLVLGSGDPTGNPLGLPIAGSNEAQAIARDKAKDAALASAKATVGVLSDAVGADGARALLYVLFVVAGASLAVAGLARATGASRVAGAVVAARTGGKL